MFLDIFLKTPSVCIPSKRLTNAPFPGKDSPGCKPIISVLFEIGFLFFHFSFYIPCKCLCSLEDNEIPYFVLRCSQSP